MSKQKNMNPGSPDAAEEGCTCAVIDNGRGNEELGRIRGFYITVGCPVHDIRTEEDAELREILFQLMKDAIANTKADDPPQGRRMLLDDAVQLIIRRDEQRALKPMWYICTDFVRLGGKPVLGGFETKGLALKVRHMFEKQTGRTYAVDTLTNPQQQDKEEE